MLFKALLKRESYFQSDASCRTTLTAMTQVACSPYALVAVSVAIPEERPLTVQESAVVAAIFRILLSLTDHFMFLSGAWSGEMAAVRVSFEPT